MCLFMLEHIADGAGSHPEPPCNFGKRQADFERALFCKLFPQRGQLAAPAPRAQVRYCYSCRFACLFDSFVKQLQALVFRQRNLFPVSRLRQYPFDEIVAAENPLVA